MNNIKKLRKLYKKTQAEIAEIIDYPKPLYAAFERGTLKMLDGKIKKLAAYYNVSIEYLLKDTYED